MATVQRYVNTGSTAGGDGTTNATSGSTRAYASLSEWEANSGGSATDDYVVDCCAEDTGSGNVADTTAVNVDFTTNITTGSITIRANTGVSTGFYNGDAVISTAHYRLNAGVAALTVSETNTTIDGLQIIPTGGANRSGINPLSGGFVARRCRLHTTSSTRTGIGPPNTTFGHSGSILVENCLIVGFDAYGMEFVAGAFRAPTVTIQHNTIYGEGSSIGIRIACQTNGGGTWVVKGNASGNTGDDLSDGCTGVGTATVTYDDNAFATTESTSGEIALGTLTDAWTSPGTSTSSDFTVKNGSSPLNFTVTGSLVSDDIRGTTRSNYSVGAFEFVASTTDTAIDADGAATGTATGASTIASALSASGEATGTLEGTTGATITETTLTAAGEATATGVGAAVLSSDLDATGAATATATGASLIDTVLDATGTATGTAAAASIASSDLSAAGEATGTLEGSEVAVGVESGAASSEGTATATAASASIASAAASAAGAATATAEGASTAEGAFSSAGAATAIAVGSDTDAVVTPTRYDGWLPREVIRLQRKRREEEALIALVMAMDEDMRRAA